MKAAPLNPSPTNTGPVSLAPMAGTVLVARMDNAGDVLLAGPAVRAVAAHVDEVVLLTGPRGSAAAELLPGVDGVIEWCAPWIDPEPVPVTAQHVAAPQNAVRAQAARAALLLTSFHQSPLPLALLLRLAGVSWIGAISEDYPGSLLDLRHRIEGDLPEAQRALHLAQAAGYRLPAGDDGRLAVRRPLPRVEHLTGAPGYVVVHAGAGPRGSRSDRGARVRRTRPQPAQGHLAALYGRVRRSPRPAVGGGAAGRGARALLDERAGRSSRRPRHRHPRAADLPRAWRRQAATSGCRRSQPAVPTTTGGRAGPRRGADRGDLRGGGDRAHRPGCAGAADRRGALRGRPRPVHSQRAPGSPRWPASHPVPRAAGRAQRRRDDDSRVAGGAGRRTGDCRRGGDATADAELARLTALAQECGVRERVRIARADVPALLRSADVVVSVPWYEPFGMVPLEAMACGVPVVASAVGGHLDTVLDGRTGALVAPRDPAALAQRLRELLADPGRLAAIGSAAAAWARSRYGWDRIARETELLYRQVRLGAGAPTATVPGGRS